MTFPQTKSTLKLTHFGRLSAKPYEVTIWFTQVDGELWIGSLDIERSWVRNLRHGGRARIDFGQGPEDVAAEFLDNDADRERYAQAIAAKYPILSRVIGLFVRGKRRAVFRITPIDPLAA
jgi:deazaflavin-dependent oxidoreductase (nitroreductase family)